MNWGHSGSWWVVGCDDGLWVVMRWDGVGWWEWGCWLVSEALMDGLLDGRDGWEGWMIWGSRMFVGNCVWGLKDGEGGSVRSVHSPLHVCRSTVEQVNLVSLGFF